MRILRNLDKRKLEEIFAVVLVVGTVGGFFIAAGFFLYSDYFSDTLRELMQALYGRPRIGVPIR